MSIEALLAIVTTAGIICLIIGVERVVRRDRTGLDKRLRRYGGRAYQLTEDEQKQAASAQVTPAQGYTPCRSAVGWPLPSRSPMTPLRL